MSQHDMNLADAAGASFRSDANNALAALVTNSSGATAPSTTFAYQWWADTTSGWLKQRNAANSAWIHRLPLGTGARTDIASAATLDLDGNTASSDYLRITGTTATTAITLADGQKRLLVANAAWPITHGASLICPGSASYTCAAGDLVLAIGEPAGVVRLAIWKADGTAVVSSTTSFASSAENVAGTVENKAVDPLGIREAFNCTGTAPVYACRAWVNFNGTGTPAIRASGNVTSITDNGVGDYTINFTTALPDANYSCVGNHSSSSSGVSSLTLNNSGATAPTTSACRISCFVSGAAVDPTYVNLAFFR